MSITTHNSSHIQAIKNSNKKYIVSREFVHAFTHDQGLLADGKNNSQLYENIILLVKRLVSTVRQTKDKFVVMICPYYFKTQTTDRSTNTNNEFR